LGEQLELASTQVADQRLQAGRGVVEARCHLLGRQPVGQVGAQGLIAPLRRAGRPEEELPASPRGLSGVVMGPVSVAMGWSGRLSLTWEAARVPWWPSSTNGHCRGTCAAMGSRTFVLDRRALVPHLHHGGPRRSCWPVCRGRRCPPPVPLFVGWSNRTAHMGRRRLEDGGHQGPRALPWQTGF
jgi:hypothetical protein